ncbi:hypothetical protein C5167_015755 [Papaver somniferum]|uniref:Uncharacterized protein n=1 Tax=Papaver somniferum TaxID=3469 RepID=A0A4Y7JAZ1_PAPSO|nr:uncharacterized protein LOC113358792 [Papaver somniferum]RZC56889.1 hypothetical protein C5167_015755 [Papaver somniferum]
MDGYLPMKMKRKDLEEVSDEFSDFSLSSPARKIRRLDAELSPIMEEPIGYDQIIPDEEQRVSPIIPVVEEVEDDVIILPVENEERAIVLYKPMENSPSLNSLSSFEVTVNSDLIPSIKDRHGLWSGHRGLLKDLDNEEERRRKENAGGKGECLAVVPWVASQFPSASGNNMATADVTTNDPMEAEVEVDNADMDIEMDQMVNDMGVVQGQEQPIAMGAGGGFQQWSQPQQHCMTPPFPQNNSTPIMWSW